MLTIVKDETWGSTPSGVLRSWQQCPNYSIMFMLNCVPMPVIEDMHRRNMLRRPANFGEA